jgi:hypothetical protein
MQKLSLDETTATPDMTAASAVGPTAQPMSGSNLDGPRNFGQNRPLSSTAVGSSSMRRPSPIFALVLVGLAITAGIATGYGGYKLKSKGTLLSAGESSQPIQQVAGSSVKAGEVFGIQDEKTFKDSAEGYLEEGGIGGEGSHKLVRAGGVSQTVVLTSSVTDLAKFEGMNVKIWGETFKAQKAGWLMDVGRVQVVDVSGKAPSEE